MQDSDGSDAGDGQAPPDPRTARVVKKGILSKKSRSKFMSGPWTLRTVVLGADNKLYYYDGKVFKGEVVLSGTSTNHIANDAADTRTFPFQITNIPSVKRTQCNTLTLSAGSFQEADDWVSCINTAAAGSGSSGPSGYVTMEVCTSFVGGDERYAFRLHVGVCQYRKWQPAVPVQKQLMHES